TSLCPGIYILGLCFPGCFSIRGPASVRGREQGSLTVQCRYDPKWKNYVKWWCKGAKIVQTTFSEREVRSGRVSIRDYPANLTFTVTLDSLTEEDEGTYKCGILSPFGHDPMFQVTVSVFPGEPHTLPLYQLRGDPLFLLSPLLVVPWECRCWNIFARLPLTWSMRGHHCHGRLMRYQPHSCGPGGLLQPEVGTEGPLWGSCDALGTPLPLQADTITPLFSVTPCTRSDN
uniref:Ig-like domain-containing protein n=1 Tax=Rhinolophus ferrumequinum TaxID=59479 RepID=A0A671EMK7_RHIFE